ELGAYRALVGHARAGWTPVGAGAPLTDWQRLGVALRAEGLMAATPASVPVAAPDTGGVLSLRQVVGSRRGRQPAAAWAWRAAAATLLLAGGVAGGRLSAGASALPGLPGSATDPASRVAAILADSAPLPVSSDEAMAVL